LFISKINFKNKKYYNKLKKKNIIFYCLYAAKGSSKCNWPRRQMGLGHQDLNLILKPLCCGASIGEGRQGREIWGWGLGKEEGFRKVGGGVEGEEG
jgi:hypothetical protein